jgi:hypothetical protein
MAQSTPTREPKVEEPSLAKEIAAIPYEPLLPVERKLVAGSLLLGFALLGLLWWASATLFPIPTVPR